MKTMFRIAVAACLGLGASTFAMADGFNTLTQTTVVRLDTDASDIGIWIAYPGKISHVCGIQIKAGSDLVQAQALADAIELNAGALAPAAGSLLATTLWSGDRTIGFGAMLHLKTKSGASFLSVVEALIAQGTTDPTGQPTLLIAEAQLCH